MTVQDFLVRAFNQVPSTEYSPYTPGTTNFDLTQPGAIYTLALLNDAYKRVVNWKFPDGTLLRFRQFYERIVTQLSGYTTLISGYQTNTVGNFVQASIVLGVEAFSVTNRYVRWIFAINGDRKLITAYDGTTKRATLSSPLASSPTDGAQANVYKKWFDFNTASGAGVHVGEYIPVDPKTGLLALQEVWDIDHRFKLDKPSREDYLYEYMDIQQMPGEWRDTSTGMEFRFPPIDGTTYDFRFYAVPEVLALATDSPVIPTAWHEPILQWLVQQLHLEQRDFDKAYAVRKNMESLISTLAQPFEISLDLSLGKLVVVG